MILKTYYSVKSDLHKWIISHPRLIQPPIKKDYIKVKFNDGIGGENTEIQQKVILQVSVRELHIDMLKKCATGFPWHMMKKDFSILLIILFN